MAIGFIHFDRGASRNTACEVLVAQERVGELIRNKYVKITNPSGDSVGGRSFLGRVIEGPYFRPEEVSADSAIAQTPILQGDSFPSLPNFYAVGGIEILGEMIGDKVIGCNTRPAPKAAVTALTSEELRQLLGIDGDVLLGAVDGYSDLMMQLRSGQKSILPRNVGIFGTVGSGKTNSAQVLIEETAAVGWSVVIVDVEGEYISMDQASGVLNDYLKESFGLDPEGLKDFEVYVPAAAETARKNPKTFTLRIADIDPLVITELIEAVEAQERRLLEVLEWLEHDAAKGKDKYAPKTITSALGAKAVSDSEPPYTLELVIETINEWAFVGKPTGSGAKKPASGSDLASYLALKGKLGGLRRTGAFDTPGVPKIKASELLKPGKVSVFDVSSANDRLKNLVIAQLLREVFDAKRDDAKLPPTMLMIEEAHTFISAEKSSRMQETIELLREIARRGRKRWLGLTFISQQPSHLPNEIFELCNTRIVHNVKSQNNLRALKSTAGDVSDEIWDMVPALGVGQALVSTPQYRDPIVVNMRPSKTKREFVD